MTFSRALQDLFFYTSRRRSGHGYDRATGYENIRDDFDESKPMAFEMEKQESGLMLLSDLVLLARDHPNHWVCESCMALHPVSRGDSPLNPNHSTCPQGWQQSPHNRFGHSAYRLSHRHIQLAFKYTRLRKWRHHLHLRRLLAETHAAFTPNPLCTALDGEFSAYPKIVNGRFLLFSTWTFFPGDQNPSEKGMGALRICEHQSFVGDPRLLLRAPQQHAGRDSSDVDDDDDDDDGQEEHHGYEYEHAHAHAHLAARGAPGNRRAQKPKTALSRIIHSAFRRPHHEICSSCAHCPTDFSVQVTPERAIVRVWQDFGGDGSPLDPAWTIHAQSEPEAEAEPDAAAALPHVPSAASERKSGSIRESFGHCMREALHDIRNRKESCEAMGSMYIF